MEDSSVRVTFWTSGDVLSTGKRCDQSCASVRLMWPLCRSQICREERLPSRGQETIATVQTLMVRVRAETAVTQGNYKMQTKINKDAI